MSLASPLSPNVVPPRDQLDLDRLADELAAREQGNEVQDRIELPAALLAPLSHEHPYLAADTFDVEEFLLSRAHTSLPDLRTELRSYLASLKDELVALINDDYEAFISLSTDLQGEGVRLERLKFPLGELREEVLKSRKELDAVSASVQEKLDRRTALRDEKNLLQLLLKISDSTTRLESLLLIASSEQGGETVNGYITTQREDGQSQGNRSKHLSRVAAEYIQLSYHVEKATEENCAFASEMSQRIGRIRSTLTTDLDQLFSGTLRKMHSKITESEKKRLATDIEECLRTYDLLRGWRDAEDVIRRDSFRPFVRKTIFNGSLTAPHSPVVPRTPFVANSQPYGNVDPRTPFTPFTAFASQTNPFESSWAGERGSRLPLLDDRDDPLAGLYNKLLRFIEQDIQPIVERAERVNARSARRSVNPMPVAENNIDLSGAVGKGDQSGFEILANMVWPEIARAISDELGSVVFAVGKPDEFRKHYITTQAFVSVLEYLSPSSQSITTLREHESFTAFDRRWQLPVYFQLRWKEIVLKLEDALSAPVRTDTPASAIFVFKQTEAVWSAISSCWSGEVYIPELGHRFWRFTLQIISRYNTWLKTALPRLEVPRGVNETEIAAKPEASSPSELMPDVSALEDSKLKQYAAAIADIRQLQSKLRAFWTDDISRMLSTYHNVIDAEPEESESSKDVLEHTLTELSSILPVFSVFAIVVFTRRACDVLNAVKSIPSQYRAMSSKKRPTEPSHFVSLVFRPLRTFFDDGGVGASLREEFQCLWAGEIFEAVVARYMAHLVSVKKTEESLRWLKKGKKTFSLFGSGGNQTTGSDDGVSADENRVRVQMAIDVNAVGRDAEKLGVQVQDSDRFSELLRIASADM